MAWGASVMGAMGAIAQLKPVINVAGDYTGTENLPSGTAMRPVYIIKIMNGKTVEIIFHGCGGPLILADALSFAQKMGAKRMR